MSDIERELREHFGALRARDGESAPEFRAAWTRAIESTGARRRRFPAYVWVAAAGLVVMAAGLAVRSAARGTAPEDRRQPVSDAIAELMRWTPPTDALLPVAPGAMRATPTILRSVLDDGIPLTIDTTSLKGD
jgi:hypothetical protein